MSTAAGLATSYPLDRESTWRRRARAHRQVREVVLYTVVSVIGLAPTLACLALSECVWGSGGAVVRGPDRVR